VRRHARLVDYRVGEGNNARAWLRFSLTNDLPAGLPKGTRCATASGATTGPFLDRTPLAYRQAADAGVAFFETIDDAAPLLLTHAEMPLYAWSDRVACVPAGATGATLAGSFPDLKAGTVLILAEKLGPLTGTAGDADPAKRQAVRLARDATVSTDPVTSAAVTEIEWHPADALTFPLCTASITDAEHGEQPIAGVSVAWGNVVLADHGRSVGVASDPLTGGPETIGVVGSDGRPFRPQLADGPLTFAATPPGTAQAAAAAASMPVGTISPCCTIHSVEPDGNAQDWQGLGDLLVTGVDPNTPAFVAEVETDDRATLRFGDGVNGLRPPAGAVFTATYRVGIGTAANVGRNAIALLDAADLPPAARTAIAGVSNPMPAWGGVDPESIEHVRQSAPVAFHEQKRAVTADDYGRVALQYPGVRRAAATFRWTGSWTTVFLTVERQAEHALDAGFIHGLEAFVDGFRMAGFDLEVEDAVRVPLVIAMQVCVRAGYIRTDVERAIRDVFTNQVLPNGTLGVFHPDRLGLGQPFYLSPLYHEAQDIDGVASVHISRFERQRHAGDEGMRTGVLIPDRLELFVLENDPNFPERGLFELSVGGGI
jgi:hypothetical protein